MSDLFAASWFALVPFEVAAGLSAVVSIGASFATSSRWAGVATIAALASAWAVGLGLIAWAQGLAVGPDWPPGDYFVHLLPEDEMEIAGLVTKVLSVVTALSVIPTYRAWGPRGVATLCVLLVAAGAAAHSRSAWESSFHAIWGIGGAVRPLSGRWDAAREQVWLMGSLAMCVAAFGPVRPYDASSRRSHALGQHLLVGGLLLVGIGVFAATRAHHFDARHPLPRHGRGDVRPTWRHPEGRRCDPAPWRPTLDLDRLDEAVLRRQVREWSLLHPAEPFRVHVLRPPTPEEWEVARNVASSPLVLLTERQWTVRTATRGELVLWEACEVPLVDPTERRDEDRAFSRASSSHSRGRARRGVPDR